MRERIVDDLPAGASGDASVREAAAFRAVLDQHSIISVTDGKGRIIDANPQFCAISGFTREELLGKDHRVLNSGHHPKSFWVEVWRTLASGRAWRGEVCNRAKDGSLYWVDSIIAPFMGADGRAERYVSIRNDITARKRAERQAAENERMRRALFDQTHQLGGLLDRGGVVLDINKAALQFGDVEAGEVLGRPFWEAAWWAHSAELQGRVREAVLRAAAGEHVRFESSHPWPDGSSRTVDWSMKPARDERGEVAWVLPEGRDVTELRRREEELRSATERLELATRAGRVATWDYDPVHDRLVWDAEAFRLYGVSREEFDGTIASWRRRVIPEDAARVEVELLAALRGERELDTEFRVVRPDGTLRSVRSAAVVQRDSRGRAVRITGANWDVTEERESASRMLALAESLEEAQSVARMGSWSYDLETGRISWSRQLYALYERREEDGPPDLAGVLSDYHPDAARALEAAVRRAVADGTPYSLVLRTAMSGTGARFVRGEGRARRDSSGRIVSLYGTATDITAEVESAEALRAARAQAEAASRAKSAFLANMSHEIRTPLTAILGFADLLRDDAETQSSAERRAQVIETIRNAGQHLLTIINDVLDLSKIEADRMTVERVETPVVRILGEVEGLMRPKAEGKGVSYATRFAGAVPDRVLTDPTRLRQVLMNIVGNAVKFTEGGGVTVTAGVERLEDVERLVFDVEDSGPGMTAEQAARLFEAFVQADDTVTRRHGGTGLGLTICRRLAALMGGDVKLLRTAVGEGSTFRLTLPLERAEGARAVSVPDPGSPAGAGGAAAPAPALTLRGRVLLAEDGIDNQRLISLHLRKAGASVEVADNGRVALEMVRAAAAAGTPYDLLLTDMQMPEMDGYALARALRSEGSGLAIVALTAHAMAEDRARCLEAGCDDYATKPIDKVKLVATCAAWMGTPGGAGAVGRAARGA